MCTAEAPAATVQRDVDWVRQHDDLWVGRLDGLPFGTIEGGRRFTFISAAGVAHPGYRSLVDAQRAATAPPALIGEQLGWTARSGERLFIGATGALVVALCAFVSAVLFLS